MRWHTGHTPGRGAQEDGHPQDAHSTKPIQGCTVGMRGSNIHARGRSWDLGRGGRGAAQIPRS